MKDGQEAVHRHHLRLQSILLNIFFKCDLVLVFDISCVLFFLNFVCMRLVCLVGRNEPSVCFGLRKLDGPDPSENIQHKKEHISGFISVCVRWKHQKCLQVLISGHTHDHVDIIQEKKNTILHSKHTGT